MNENTIEEIKSRCNIVDVIGRVVALKKAGSNYKGLCPFHNEKTPSFVVSEDKQYYTCFGCGASGDVIEFMQRYYNMDFVQAVEKLADECGVTIEAGYRDNGKKKELLELNREAAKFFYKSMRVGDNPGMAYMKGRGIDQDTLREFGVGYADSSWDSLYRYLRNMGYEEDKMVELGLISQSGSSGKYFDKFRDRVIFPIIDTRGKVVGFGGRIIGEGNPKYLNSRESSVFLKKNNLYGLNLTRQYMGREGKAILVEGYMDVISLYQSGVRNVSASLGTALTENQAKMLKRYSRDVVLSYDADAAGQAAAMRGMDILHNEGCRVRVLHVAEGKDPDEFVKSRGREAFMKLVDDALPFADYKIAVIKAGYDMTRTDQRAEFMQKAVGVLKLLSPVEAEVYVKKIAAENDISEGAIRAEMKRGTEETGPGNAGSRSIEEAAPDISSREKTLIKILLTDSSYMERAGEFASLFTSEVGREMYQALRSSYVPGVEIERARAADSITPERAEVLEQIDRDISLGGKIEEVFRECTASLTHDELKEKEKMLLAQLEMADEKENSSEIERITAELMKTQKKLKNGGK